jgi:hypothetical protein
VNRKNPLSFRGTEPASSGSELTAKSATGDYSWMTDDLEVVPRWRKRSHGFPVGEFLAIRNINRDIL